MELAEDLKVFEEVKKKLRADHRSMCWRLCLKALPRFMHMRRSLWCSSAKSEKKSQTRRLKLQSRNEVACTRPLPRPAPRLFDKTGGCRPTATPRTLGVHRGCVERHLQIQAVAGIHGCPLQLFYAVRDCRSRRYQLIRWSDSKSTGVRFPFTSLTERWTIWCMRACCWRSSVSLRKILPKNSLLTF